VLVRADDGAIHRVDIPVPLLCGVSLLLDRSKEASPEARLAPAVEAAGDGGPAAIPLGRCTESARSALSSVQPRPYDPSPTLQPSPRGRGSKGHSLREGPKEQGSVSTTEAEGVAHGGAYMDLARGVRDVIQVTLGIGMLIVDGGRQHPIA
jgi:hypothetical protein